MSEQKIDPYAIPPFHVHVNLGYSKLRIDRAFNGTETELHIGTLVKAMFRELLRAQVTQRCLEHRERARENPDGATHHACDKIIEHYGAKAPCCECVAHSCQYENCEEIA